MKSIHAATLDFRRLELLAQGNSPVHQLDARAKVLVTFAFLVSVVSFDRYQVSALLPFFVYPVAMVGLGQLPMRYLCRKTFVVLPFALAVGIFNPIFDREIAVQFGGVGISGGWVSCLSIVLRAILTVSAALILVAATGMPGVCRALQQLGVPNVFVTQLLFLYRYIFVLTEEAACTSRARELRSFGGKLGVRTFGSIAGHLLVRTWERAERVYMAMLARGFSGVFYTRECSRFGACEFRFVAGWIVTFLIMRLWNIPQIMGQLITRSLS